jgi:hypothetical protein
MVSMRALNRMGKDITNRVSETRRNLTNNVSETLSDVRGAMVNLPRNTRTFCSDTLKGYATEQTMTSANAYHGDVLRKFRDVGMGGELFGGLIGSVQDGLTAAGTIFYFAGMDNNYTKAAGIVAGAKVVSNIVAGLVKWYKSAESRT